MLKDLIEFIEQNKLINDKSKLARLVQRKFSLVKDRSVFYNSHFAIRFSKANSKNFSNTIAGLSRLQKYDDRPFVVCLVLKDENVLWLANTTFLKKISHSSQELRVDNIKGSFNGSDIFKEFNEIKNSPENFDELFEIHKPISFEENLTRLVEATNNIVPTGKKFEVTNENKGNIFNAPQRAITFTNSEHFKELKSELDEIVNKYQNEILIAALIENVNIRGRIIEYLITGKDKVLRENIIQALQRKTEIPNFKTENELGDYNRDFGVLFHTATDVKTKIMFLDSNPKAYNLDKMLDFLSKDNSVFMFYFVGINLDEVLEPILISMFHRKILESIILIKHWAGRSSRGVSQLNGSKIKEFFKGVNLDEISKDESKKFLQEIISL